MRPTLGQLGKFAVTPQPAPLPGREDVRQHVIGAMLDRMAFGKEHYGTPLQTFNGRDALADAFQESLDLLQYLTQALLEREAFEGIGGISEDAMNARVVVEGALYTSADDGEFWLEVQGRDGQSLAKTLHDLIDARAGAPTPQVRVIVEYRGTWVGEGAGDVSKGSGCTSCNSDCRPVGGDSVDVGAYDNRD
jgi:hypothetical protein